MGQRRVFGHRHSHLSGIAQHVAERRVDTYPAMPTTMTATGRINMTISPTATNSYHFFSN
jgi:hypothetical protein